MKIGYVSRDNDNEVAGHRDALMAIGCDAVRVETPAPGDSRPVLRGVLDFLGEGDELAVPALRHLCGGATALRDTLADLEARGTTLRILDDGPVEGSAWRVLRELVAAIAAHESVTGRQSVTPGDILALRGAGLSQVQIARRLGISRMTVWRRLRENPIESASNSGLRRTG